LIAGDNLVNTKGKTMVNVEYTLIDYFDPEKE
jgi:hypothetical protein